MADDSYYFDYFESAALLKGLIVEVQSLLDEKPDEKGFYFPLIYHCFQQYEVIRAHLIEKDQKFGMVPIILDNLNDSQEMQYDIISRRFLEILVAHSKTCIRFIEHRLDSARAHVFEEQIEEAHIKLAKPQSFSQDELNKLVSTIVLEFKAMVEDRGSWKLFWNREQTKHVWEDVVQQLFYLFASSICDSNDIDLSPETNAGVGSVDFKFSSSAAVKHLVEFKMSSSPKLLPGFTRQIEAYKKAERTDHASYVVIEVSEIETQKQALNELTEANAGTDLFFVDAKPRESASKL